MSINPRENLFAQLPQNVRNHIGYFVVIDLMKEQAHNPCEFIKPYLCMQRKKTSSEDVYEIESDDCEKQFVADEAEVFNLIKQGYDYDGIDATLSNDTPHYQLTKQRHIINYMNTGTILILTPYEIIHGLTGLNNPTCVFKRNLIIQNIDSLLPINQFKHADTFKFIGYFAYAHAIAVRTINTEKTASNDDPIIIQLPLSKESPPFLDDFFYNEQICKKINLPLILDGQK